MHDLFELATESIALGLEAIAAVLIAVGGLGAMYRLIRGNFKEARSLGPLREAWLYFARWILLGLEFTMGADIVRTAIAPTWDSIGQLASIALIRTFLSYFLERDLELAHKTETGEKTP
ncbi:DUF1622 domain-containing protein [Bdellovibrio sp. HCB337]|uniref:DUF1622 domain-containing protein n=1 Tax=Bdellovibrio sp. HCB337 TaxID=3394358 RepID=UPI0039A445CD